jgi:hypothetical protein
MEGRREQQSEWSKTEEMKKVRHVIILLESVLLKMYVFLRYHKTLA